MTSAGGGSQSGQDPRLAQRARRHAHSNERAGNASARSLRGGDGVAQRAPARVAGAPAVRKSKCMQDQVTRAPLTPLPPLVTTVQPRAHPPSFQLMSDNAICYCQYYDHYWVCQRPFLRTCTCNYCSPRKASPAGLRVPPCFAFMLLLASSSMCCSSCY